MLFLIFLSLFMLSVCVSDIFIFFSFYSDLVFLFLILFYFSCAEKPAHTKSAGKGACLILKVLFPESDLKYQLTEYTIARRTGAQTFVTRPAEAPHRDRASGRSPLVTFIPSNASCYVYNIHNINCQMLCS